MFTIDYAPFAVHHDAIDREPVTGKHEGIQQGLVAVPDKHGIVVVQRDQDSAVVDALRQLSQRDQEVLMLSTWDDLSAPEIAIVLDISVNAAQQRIFRARKRLARLVTVEHPGLFDVSTAEGGAS